LEFADMTPAWKLSNHKSNSGFDTKL